MVEILHCAYCTRLTLNWETLSGGLQLRSQLRWRTLNNSKIEVSWLGTNFYVSTELESVLDQSQFRLVHPHHIYKDKHEWVCAALPAEWTDEQN